MATVFEFLPSIFVMGLIALAIWAFFGRSGHKKPKVRQQVKRDFYRWDDRAVHRD